MSLTWEAISPSVIRSDTDDCWLWNGSVTIDGYGKVHGYLAHRVVYELLVGPIPNGLQIDHLCMVTACVNPAHLEPVTDLENKRRRYVYYTHCSNGHEFTLENTYTRPGNGWRDCRACIRDRVRRYKARRAA